MRFVGQVNARTSPSTRLFLLRMLAQAVWALTVSAIVLCGSPTHQQVRLGIMASSAAGRQSHVMARSHGSSARSGSAPPLHSLIPLAVQVHVTAARRARSLDRQPADDSA
eukprot:6046752-Amphidinium_carterae.1